MLDDELLYVASHERADTSPDESIWARAKVESFLAPGTRHRRDWSVCVYVAQMTNVKMF